MQISAITWIIGSLIMGINIYFLVDHLINVIVHGNMAVVGKVFCGVLGFSGMLIHLAGIGYLVMRKNKEASHLLALTTPDCSCEVKVEDALIAIFDIAKVQVVILLLQC